MRLKLGYVIAAAVMLFATAAFSGVKPITSDGYPGFVQVVACDNGTMDDALKVVKDEIAQAPGIRLVVQKQRTTIALAFLKKLLGEQWQAWGDTATDIRALTLTGGGRAMDGGAIYFANKNGCYLGYARLHSESFQGLLLANARGSV